MSAKTEFDTATQVIALARDMLVEKRGWTIEQWQRTTDPIAHALYVYLNSELSDELTVEELNQHADGLTITLLDPEKMARLREVSGELVVQSLRDPEFSTSLENSIKLSAEKE